MQALQIGGDKGNVLIVNELLSKQKKTGTLVVTALPLYELELSYIVDVECNIIVAPGNYDRDWILTKIVPHYFETKMPDIVISKLVRSFSRRAPIEFLAGEFIGALGSAHCGKKTLQDYATIWKAWKHKYRKLLDISLYAKLRIADMARIDTDASFMIPRLIEEHKYLQHNSELLRTKYGVDQNPVAPIPPKVMSHITILEALRHG